MLTYGWMVYMSAGQKKRLDDDDDTPSINL